MGARDEPAPAEPILSLVLMPWMSASAKDDLPQGRSTMQRLHHGDETCLLRCHGSPRREELSYTRQLLDLEENAKATVQLEKKESDTTANSAVGKAERTFAYKGQPLPMLQHLKIGVKDLPNRSLRLRFEWDPDDGVVVIGHCGRHRVVQGH